MGERTSLGPTTPRPLNQKKGSRSFKNYLLERFPLGLPYTERGNLDGISKMVDDDRDTCGNFTGLAGGVPEIHHRIVERLDGVPASKVREAIETLRSVDNHRINGPVLVTVLEAKIHGRPVDYSEATVHRYFNKAAELLESMVGIKEVA